MSTSKVIVVTVIAGVITAWIIARFLEPKGIVYKTGDGKPPLQLVGVDPTEMFTVVPNARQGTVGGKAEFQ